MRISLFMNTTIAMLFRYICEIKRVNYLMC